MSDTTDANDRVDRDSLERFITEVLRAVDVPTENATVIAKGLTRADLRGVHTHGIARLDAYVDKLDDGGFDPDPDLSAEDAGEAAVVVDGDDGPGHVVGRFAMEEAIHIAETSGIGIAAVHDSNHFGTGAFHTQYAASEGCIGIAMSTVESDVVPYGGQDAVLGTDPISVAIPRRDSFPMTLDIATSVVAMGKIAHVASVENETVPADWGVDDAGDPTTDPNEVAALRPFGDHKGYGLAIVVEILAGLLSGAGPSPSVKPLYEASDTPMELGHFFVAIDVSLFRDSAEFEADVEAFVEDLKSVPTRDGFDEILVPGEPEYRTRTENERRGVPLTTDAKNVVDHLASEYDVPPPE